MGVCLTAVTVCCFASTYSNDHSKEGNRNVLAAAAETDTEGILYDVLLLMAVVYYC